jgi:hypothetical protein
MKGRRMGSSLTKEEQLLASERPAHRTIPFFFFRKENKAYNERRCS